VSDAFGPRSRRSGRAATRLAGFATSIAIALGGCHSRYPVPVGEADPVDYSMAGSLAPGGERSSALARNGLADGYLTSREANEMWAAYGAEREARNAAEKAEVIKRWRAK
jgi:hypothetical protein